LSEEDPEDAANTTPTLVGGTVITFDLNQSSPGNRTEGLQRSDRTSVVAYLHVRHAWKRP
jgi:hypothetical protein